MTIGWLGLRRVAKYRVLEGGAHNGVSKFCFKASTQSGTLVREGEQHAFDLMMSVLVAIALRYCAYTHFQ